jgi:hypothetical protein
MIVFDLACSANHVFEAWFGSSDDYEAQRARGLLACPICGTAEVTKSVMAPAVGAKGNSREVAVPMQSGGHPAPAEMKALLTALARAQAKALEGSEHVGRRFAEEARAIHDGDAPSRVIHGEATTAEAKALIEDGVPVTPLPLPIVPPESSH